MPSRRLSSALLICLGALALALPAGALAGGSAGNQQYTDPFGGTSSATTTAPASTTAPPPPSSPTTTPAATGPAPAAATQTAPATSAADPATTASSAQALPYTGFAVPTAAGFGAVLLGSGLLLRRRARPAR